MDDGLKLFEPRFSELFTSEASDLLLNYLESLKKYMLKVGISNQQQNVVVDGIFEFINEFHENYKNARINFSDSLKLIDEIGSPSEIIQSFDFKTEKNEKNVIICSSCKAKNSIESIYCEYCGKSIKFQNSNEKIKKDSEYSKLSYYRSNIKQDFIDHPYSRSFIILMIGFTLIISILFSFSPNWNIEGNSSPILIFVLIILMAFVVSIPFSLWLCLIIGLIADYALKDAKSKKFQYNKIIEHFEENIVGGFILVLIGISALFIIFSISPIEYNNSQNIVIIFSLWLILMLIDLGFLAYYGNTSYRPYFLNLNQLNLLKIKIGKSNPSKYYSFNKNFMMPLIILGIITDLIMIQDLNPSTLFLGAFLFTIVYLAIINGFFMMKINSWKTILEDSSKEEL